eukprot:CAMPEP_0198590182 /NCGR_PEP_ID=MMETSP1462-20131121/135358_1 /TAXON_ID=1333877 /ORGANISM="Brandtodinium nutriculum, Strain RCC3387" /LENGTH=215 /DNA_ID=CAMNT_0044321717 /DNA_START=78 /DNA_END=722 /DNA_ORIENTATION=-
MKNAQAAAALPHPLLSCWQHQACFLADQDHCQLANPNAQSCSTACPLRAIPGAGAPAATAVAGMTPRAFAAAAARGETPALQPLCLWSQHQAFFDSDHPEIQFAYPAWQSYGFSVGALAEAVEQPRPACWQHQSFLAADHVRCQLSWPISQLGNGAALVAPTPAGKGDAAMRGRVMHPVPLWGQHHARLAADHPATDCGELALQSYNCPCAKASP